ncbi:MAG: radical SAM protein [Clostridia bacterium]|nr:radical SAM protein [Clostridia bacterium]
MIRHVNIPVFIPHLGCPNQCVFCNQRTITGTSKFCADDVRDIIEDALNTIEEGTEVEIAIFGGSFTGIDFDLMCRLLEIAYSYILAGRVSSIRCSTRPDYIDGHILSTLKKYGVKVIELGLQSTSDKVLTLTKRAHSFEAEERACKMIVEAGFELVGQMMIGLPGSTLELEEETARFIASVRAKGARIYPTVVFRNTELCDMTENGSYVPLSLDDAILRSARALKIFKDAGIPVIRIGLCASDNLSAPDTYFAGPNHSALGELVENEFYYELIKEKIEKADVIGPQSVTVFGSRGSLSKMIGQKRKNKLRLIDDFPLISFSFAESADVEEYDVRLQYEERK